MQSKLSRVLENLRPNLSLTPKISKSIQGERLTGSDPRDHIYSKKIHDQTY